MNPGPAPRPPTDRPRLNTAATAATAATSFNQMSLSSPSTPSLSIFPNSSSLSVNQKNGQGGVNVIKEAYVRCKEDKFLASWNQRYLVLREFRLDFLKNETGKGVLAIELRNVTNVTRSEDTRMAFEITRVANPKDSGARTALSARDVATKTITCEVKTDEEVYDWIDKIYQRCPGMGVSNPTNFSHRVHVGFDPQTGAFVGLPPEWERLLTASAITKEDYKKNPQAVIEVLEFYSDIKQREQNPQQYMTEPSSVSSTASPQSNRSAPQPGLQRIDTNQSQASQGGGDMSPQTSSPAPPQRKHSEQDRSHAQQQQTPPDRSKELPDPEQRRRMDEETRRVREAQRQREEEQNRREQEEYNASLPKSRVPIAQQEVGGYGGPSNDPSRFNPSRPAPQAPGGDRSRQPPQGSLRQMTAQRPAPAPPQQAPKQGNSSSHGHHGSLRSAPRPDQSRQQQPSPGPRTQPDNRAQQPNKHKQTNQGGSPEQEPSSSGRDPAPVEPVKPLNIANKQSTKSNASQADGVRQAEAALSKKAEPPRQKEVRMSNMSETEVMERLKQVVSKDNPNDSYIKQRKIGQGASGSVYVARVKENAPSQIARELYQTQGPRGQVAIKQMDLRSQPRKELIVNEIIVMKDSQHNNVVNFLDSFLQEQNNELWVIMEFMEGGALTDVIDHNPTVQEDQIATICLEVSAFPPACEKNTRR